MNRISTVLILCVLLAAADLLCLSQTIGVRSQLSNAQLWTLLVSQVAAVFFLGSLTWTLLRKRFSRQKKPFTTR